MNKKVGTIRVRAPKNIVHTWRAKFPEVRDADIVAIMWNTSLLKAEAALTPLKEVENDIKKGKKKLKRIL